MHLFRITRRSPLFVGLYSGRRILERLWTDRLERTFPNWRISPGPRTWGLGGGLDRLNHRPLATSAIRNTAINDYYSICLVVHF